MIFIILTIIFVVFLLYMFIKRYVIDDDTITLITGSNGSGKTYFAVAKCCFEFTRLKLIIFFHNLIEYCKFWKSNKDIWEKPRFFSSIPVRLGFKRFSEPLKIAHLTLQEKLPLRCVVFIDEVNLICSQMQYKLKNEEVLNSWVTLFRHFTHGGKLCLTTQNYNKVHWIFRYCVGYVHNLSGCHKIPKICIWTKCKKVETGDDVRKTVAIEGEEDTRYLFSFFNPFYKKYDTYCFDNVNNYQGIIPTNYEEYDCYKVDKWERLK